MDEIDKIQPPDAMLQQKDHQSESEYVTTDHTISPSMSVAEIIDHVEPVVDL